MPLSSRFLRLPFFLAAAGAGILAAPPLHAVDFGSEIQPILRERCFKCHSGPQAKKGIRYDDAETLAGFIGDSDKAVIRPGKPEESLLVQLASLPRDDTHAMPPPRRGEAMTLPELNLVKQWIALGAKLDGGTPMAAAAAAAEPELLTWTNTQGNSLQAFFVKLDGSSVVLRRDDDSEFSYPLSQLSPESRRLASEQAQGR